MRTKGYDVIIVGAGPGGSTAARQAALKGLATLLIEKETFPRYKPCAGGVSQWALSNLDFQLPRQIIERHLFGGRIFFHGRYAEAYKACPIGVLVSRPAFDHVLVNKAMEAGATALFATKARDFSVRPDRVEVITNKGVHRGQSLIIAEGAMGGLARRVRGPYGKTGVAVTVVTEIESSHQEIEDRTAGKIQVHFDVGHRGYGWVFPHRDYYSVGIGEIRGRSRKPIQVFRRFVARQGLVDTGRARTHFLPVGGIRRRVACRRVLLIGDAAGFADAFAGEGIGYAIQSGKLAAETIHEALDGGATFRGDLTGFVARCENHFGKRLRQSHMMEKIVYALPNVFLKTLATHNEIVDTLFNVGIWRMTYGEFIAWFLTRLPRYLIRG